MVSSVVNVNITDPYNASSPLYVTDVQVINMLSLLLANECVVANGQMDHDTFFSLLCS